jgi:hypothetical protein
VVKFSRSNLTRQNKNSSKKLYNSMDFELNVSKNSFGLAFVMETYGIFQDVGVKGANPSKVSKNAKIRGQQAPNSPYRFGSGNYRGQWGEFVNSLEAWAKRKNIRLRDEKGKFSKGNYKTIAQILARNIYARGIKPSLFFTKPFEAAFKRLPDELIEKFGLDVDKFLEITTKESLNVNV